ncbi:MAG TPA: methyltransferase [Burkholderiales bacterium]|nr:methyltransferase [Burkholderiales bacterium]
MPKLSENSCPQRVGKTSALMELIYSGSLSQAAYVAAELGIADHLASGPRDAGELARATGSHAPSLHRLLRTLTGIELCTEREDGTFALSPMGSLLSSDAPDSLRSRFLHWGKYQWPVWGNLLYSVQTGESARNLATGTDGFKHLERDAEAAEVFNRSRVGMTRFVAADVVQAYDFSGVRRIVDVGGGHGALLAVVLEAHPDMQGVLFDMQHAMEGAQVYMANARLSKRCECIAGSFFEAVPAGADAYVLKGVIHDWNDEQSAVILRNCRRAIPQDGKLLLVERIMPARLEATPRHHAIAQADLTMLLGPGGRERTETEFRILLESTGFRPTRFIATALEYSIVEGIPS